MIDRLGKDDVFLPIWVDEDGSPGNNRAIGFLRGMEFSNIAIKGCAQLLEH